MGKLERIGYLTGKAVGLGFFGRLRGFVSRQLSWSSLALGLVAAIIVFIACIRAMRANAGTGMRMA